MELVEGVTLSGPLPVETALNYARQIADALEAAHEKGITHRDLKLTNIMVTPDGVVKVLDFGLASVTPASRQTSTQSPTMTMAATQAGVLLGTAAYMSPEQAAGKPVDKRADIWSFGVVLWEMLTGKRLFHGETVSHTLADVLRAPIDFDKVADQTPPAICQLLRRSSIATLRSGCETLAKRGLRSTKRSANRYQNGPRPRTAASPNALSCPGPWPQFSFWRSHSWRSCISAKPCREPR